MALKHSLDSIFLFSSRRLHVYSRSYCPSSQLAEKLCQNIIYNENGFLVLNKPQGISFSQSEDQEDEVSLKTCLPHLKKMLGYSQLFNVKIPEKHTSGVAILCTNEELLDKLRKSLRSTRLDGVLNDEFTAVVVGNPVFDNGQFMGGIKRLQNTNSKKIIKKANLVAEFSNNDIKKGEVKRVRLSHSVVAKTADAALVAVQANRNKWHCVRVYLSSRLLSPVLGDNMFGSRVKTLLGNTVPVDIFSEVASTPQRIPQMIQRKLGIEGRTDVAVPLHLHISRTTIHHFNKKPIEFRARLPDSFVWTCKSLSLVN